MAWHTEGATQAKGQKANQQITLQSQIGAKYKIQSKEPMGMGVIHYTLERSWFIPQ